MNQLTSHKALCLRELFDRYSQERLKSASGLSSVKLQKDYRISPHCYPGLRSFNPNEERFFFGRRRNVTEIRAKLETERIVVVQGGSGTGKSSVIRAGLMPRLSDSEALKGRPGNWYKLEFRPRTNPLESMAEAMASLVQEEFPNQSSDWRNDALGASRREPNQSLKDDVKRRILESLPKENHQLGDASEVKVPTGNYSRSFRAEALLNVVVGFAEEINQRDLLATGGLRAGPANLLILVDQFEEAFRPEAELDGLKLLDLIIAAHAFLTDSKEGAATNLFFVITMRTEELHRVGEYPSLSISRNLNVDSIKSHSLADVVTRSFYLIQVLDPDQDREDLRHAIVGPARSVFLEYELLDDNGSSADEPFAPGVVDWLLEGVRRWRDAEAVGQQKADQLPLLQHALHAMWGAALERWVGELSGTPEPKFLIEKHDLPQTTLRDYADLAECLDLQANRSAGKAVRAFGEKISDYVNAGAMGGGHTGKELGLAALRAAVRSLARRDDRGNWARKFATLTTVDEFMNVDPFLADFDQQSRIASLGAALGELVDEGYLALVDNVEYDLSHEALVRNWRQAQIWLREPTDTALALERALREVSPVKVGHRASRSEIEAAIPSQLSERLAIIDFVNRKTRRISRSGTKAEGRTLLPDSWARQQIRSIIGVGPSRRPWSDDDQEVLECIGMACVQANRVRLSRYVRRFAWGGGLTVACVTMIGYAAVYQILYSNSKEVAAGAGAFGVIGEINASVLLDNASKLNYLNGVSRYLRERKEKAVASQEQIIPIVYQQLDFTARSMLGTVLTKSVGSLVSVNRVGAQGSSDSRTLGLACLSANQKTADGPEIQIGRKRIKTKLSLNKDQEIEVVDRENEIPIVWQKNIASYQNFAKNAEIWRVCFAKDGSTLIGAIPDAYPLALSLTWKSDAGVITMDAWSVSVSATEQPPLGMACAADVVVKRRYLAEITSIRVRRDKSGAALQSQPLKELCASSSGASEEAYTFVRGVLTPVELSPISTGDTSLWECSVARIEDSPKGFLAKGIISKQGYTCRPGRMDKPWQDVQVWFLTSLSDKDRKVSKRFVVTNGETQTSEIPIDSAVAMNIDELSGEIKTGRILKVWVRPEVFSGSGGGEVTQVSSLVIEDMNQRRWSYLVGELARDDMIKTISEMSGKSTFDEPVSAMLINSENDAPWTRIKTAISNVRSLMEAVIAGRTTTQRSGNVTAE